MTTALYRWLTKAWKLHIMLFVNWCMQLQQQTEHTILLLCFSKVKYSCLNGQDTVLSGQTVTGFFSLFQAVIGGGGGAAILNFSSLPDKIHDPFAPLLLKLFTCPDKRSSAQWIFNDSPGNYWERKKNIRYRFIMKWELKLEPKIYLLPSPRSCRQKAWHPWNLWKLCGWTNTPYNSNICGFSNHIHF